MDARELMDKCNGRWFDLLQMLGGLSRIQLSGKHGPCPICGGKDRYRWENYEGRGTWICNNCTGGRREDGANLLMRIKGWSFSELASELEQSVGVAKRHIVTARTTSQSQISSMERIWHQAEAIGSDTIAAMYLQGRNIDMASYPSSLRFHPDLMHARARIKMPALIARIDAPDGSMAQIHQTFLAEDGTKADVDPPRMLHRGSFCDGSAVRIGKPNGVIGIAEGIETALSAALAHGHAVWAAVNAQMLLKWNHPTGTVRVRIFGDNDANFTGQSKAYGLANRLVMQNPDISVEVLIPDRIGSDWNDDQ